MAVVIETTLGDFTVDLYTKERPQTCRNFLKLCKIKYYNWSLFFTVQSNFIAQTGDPTSTGKGGESIYGIVLGEKARFYEAEQIPKIKHEKAGLLSMVNCGNNMLGSQFFITLGSDLQSLDGKHCIFGEITEGLEIILKFNEAICDADHRPYQDIRISHTIILEDPYEDPKGLVLPDRSPEPTKEALMSDRIGADEEINDTAGMTAEEIAEKQKEKEAKARATILEIVGDIPDAEMAPPENVLFVCKLNPVTNDDDLEIIFSRFGKIIGCEVIRDRQTGDSLQYAFIEFADKKSCEEAYFKMDNVLIDDRRIHVDFSQSVAKMRWRGKGKGIKYFDEEGKDEEKEQSRNSKRKNENYQRRSESPKKELNKYENKDKHELRKDDKRKQDINKNGVDKKSNRKKQERSRSKSYEKSKEKRVRSKSRSREKQGRSRSKSYEKSREKRVRSKSRSREKQDRSRSKEKRNRSRSREKRERSRSKSYEKSREKRVRSKSRSREKQDRSRSKEKRNRSRSREKRERSRSKSYEKSREKRLRSRSKSREKRERSRSREKRERSRSKSYEKSREKRVRSRSKSREKRERSRSREKRNRSKSRERMRVKSRDRKQRSREKSRDKRERSRDRSRDGRKNSRERSRERRARKDWNKQYESNTWDRTDHIDSKSRDEKRRRKEYHRKSSEERNDRYLHDKKRHKSRDKSEERYERSSHKRKHKYKNR